MAPISRLTFLSVLDLLGVVHGALVLVGADVEGLPSPGAGHEHAEDGVQAGLRAVLAVRPGPGHGAEDALLAVLGVRLHAMVVRDLNDLDALLHGLTHGAHRL